MKCQAARCAIVFSILGAGLWPTAGHSTEPQCLSTWVAAGQRTVTPAEIMGASEEHLALLGHHPDDDNNYRKSLPDGGYVITGDKVDLVTSCSGYAYVRFHGARRVSTGWVETTRIKTAGSAYVPLPSNAGALCQAAEATLNRGKQLQRMDTTALDPKALEALHVEEGWNVSPAQVARMTIDGRPLAATSIDTGGSCHSSSVYVLGGDLKSRLSPADRDDRDVENDGSDVWGFGVSENLVVVLGQPMVLSSGEGSSTFHLSAIDKNGDIIPTCEGGRVNLDKRRLVSSNDDRVCHAMLAGQQTSVALQAPTPGESLSLGQRPDSFKELPRSDAGNTATKLKYLDAAHAAHVEYSLRATGDVDLDNSGKPRRVGVVSFFEGNSGAGCGSYNDTQVVPVYLDEHGQADLSATINQRLVSALPRGMSEGKLVTYAGTTYFEASPNDKGPSSEIWKIDAKGPKQVCKFQLTHIVVHPISG